MPNIDNGHSSNDIMLYKSDIIYVWFLYVIKYHCAMLSVSLIDTFSLLFGLMGQIAIKSIANNGKRIESNQITIIIALLVAMASIAFWFYLLLYVFGRIVYFVYYCVKLYQTQN